MRALVACFFALGLAAAIGAQAPAKPPNNVDGADGLLHTELSLIGRTASISFAPRLRPDDPAHRDLFASAGRIRLGELQTNGVLRLGNVSVGKPAVAPLRYDLFLEATSEGWELDVATAAAPDGAASTSVGKVTLTRQPSAVASPTLVAALVPVTRDTAQLVLSWGDVRATASVQFQEVQLPFRPGAGGRQIPPVSRKHDDENVGARATMLSQLNETALVDPQGARVSVTFARTFPKGTPSQSAAGTTRRAGLVVEGPDFGRLMSTRDGAVVELTEAPALRLSIDRPVSSGPFTVFLRAGNQTPGFPGAYSLWLKRAGAEGRLVFNQEPDVWGSQRDPKSDVGEVDLAYSKGGDPSRPLGVALVPAGPDYWRLVLAWGPHEWTTIFVNAPYPVAALLRRQARVG